jgi:hypothetical protein
MSIKARTQNQGCPLPERDLSLHHASSDSGLSGGILEPDGAWEVMKREVLGVPGNPKFRG